MDFQETFRSLYDFVLNSEDFYNEKVFNGLLGKLNGLGLSLGAAVASFVMVVIYLVAYVAKAVIFMFPYMYSLGESVVEFHVTQLGFYDILFEVIAIVALIVWFLYRRAIMSYIDSVLRRIERQSKTLARAAPHIAFFSSAVLLAVPFQKFLVPMTSNSSMPLFTTFFPAATTVYAAINNKVTMYRYCMILWTVVAVYHSVATMLSSIPFTSAAFKYLPYLREVILIMTVWVQLSETCTKMVHSYFSPVLEGIVSKIPAGDIASDATWAYLQPAFFYLRFIGLMNDSIEAFLRGLLHDVLALLLAALFSMMPTTNLASVGVILVLLILPAYKTSMLIERRITAVPATPARTRAPYPNGEAMVTPFFGAFLTPFTKMFTSSKPRAPPTTVQTGNTASTRFSSAPRPSALVEDEFFTNQRRWLDYWIVASMLWGLRLYGLTLWPSVTMILAVYLQHSYFRGASWFLSFLNALSCGLIDRNARTMREKEEARALRLQNRPAAAAAAVVVVDHNSDNDSTVGRQNSSSSSSSSSSSAVSRHDIGTPMPQNRFSAKLNEASSSSSSRPSSSKKTGSQLTMERAEIQAKAEAILAERRERKAREAAASTGKSD